MATLDVVEHGDEVESLRIPLPILEAIGCNGCAQVVGTQAMRKNRRIELLLGVFSGFFSEGIVRQREGCKRDGFRMEGAIGSLLEGCINIVLDFENDTEFTS